MEKYIFFVVVNSYGDISNKIYKRTEKDFDILQDVTSKQKLGETFEIVTEDIYNKYINIKNKLNRDLTKDEIRIITKILDEPIDDKIMQDDFLECFLFES